MTEQVRHPYIDSRDRNLCDTCDEWQGAKAHRTEQARETPEPLTHQPDVVRNAVRTLGPAGTLAEGIVQQAALAHADRLDALRAATHDPADPLPLALAYQRGYDAALRAATPDPAEAGLREALQGAVDAWTAEYGPDDNAPWVTKALRALSDTTEGQS